MTKIRQTPSLQDLKTPKQNEIPDDVIPLFNQDKETISPNKTKIVYDIIMLLLLVLDLLLIMTDKILMSGFATKFAQWFGFVDILTTYQVHEHTTISAIGGVFTVFWIAELILRWMRAIIKKTYFRWFFFPFVHWYEALGCFPALRALRLLRAGVIIKRLHSMNIKVIPEKWLNSAQFYYHVILEELSDRVILTAIDNFREQLSQSKTHQALVQSTIDKNRPELEKVILDILRSELLPKLQEAFLADTGKKLSLDIGIAVEKALTDTPELRKYLKLIPIAGSLIENQITHVGKHIGENVTLAVNEHLFSSQTLDALVVHIAKGIAELDTTRPELEKLVGDVINDGLTAFEKQIKIQQWKHKEQLPHP